MATHEMNEAVSAALEACPAEVRSCLQIVMDGAGLTFEQGLKLATAGGPASEALLAVAEHLDSRSALLLLGEILRTPGLAERLNEVLRPSVMVGSGHPPPIPSQN